MRPATINGRSPAFTRRTIPVIERLETRTLLSATAAAVAHPAAVPAAVHAKATFPISDIFGAGAGIAIWQNGQPILPGSAGSASSAAIFPSSTASTLSGTTNGTLLGTATVPGGPSIFSLLPILPPDGLAAEVLGMIDLSNGTSTAFFNGSNGAMGSLGSRARNLI